MRRAAIVSPVRTPVGTFGGTLKSVSVEEMSAVVIKAILDRTNINPEKIEEVIFAQSYASGETPCIGRWAALQAGLPIETAGMQIDRRCGGGLQSVITASMMIQTGAADVVIAGGVESMSNVEFYTTDMRWGKRAGSVKLHDRLDRGRERSQPVERFGEISGMIETAENLATEYQISRQEADEYAMRSQKRAAAAWKNGIFEDEVVPITVSQRRAEDIIFDKDEGVRPDVDMEKLAKLRPIMKNGTVTAGNASQQNDAAAACLIIAEDLLESFNLEPIGYLAGWSAVGCHPSMMGIGPVGAVKKLFSKSDLSIDNMDLVELNEAFACQVLACLKGLEWNDPNRLNINGSGISLGHPIGATGIRIMTSLLHELKRRNGKYGLETMCVGGGQGIAALFEAA
ncbi:MAG: acetyl-CoA C-acyltransferase [Rhodospirillales bacterium]|nr:acetyl-CoA C-acyltransferase [Rhodospirillales bacterium]